MNDSLYMTAEEAAAALGVSVSTVYAYVSRKIIRAHRLPGVRVSKYWRADVERVRRKAPSGAARSQVDPLVSETQITVITDAGPYFRGRSAIELSESETIETVAGLLWQADSAAVFPPEAPAPSKAVERYWPALTGLSAIDKAMATFPTIERENPRAYDLSPPGFARTAGEAMRWFATILAGRPHPSAEPLHEVVAAGAEDPEPMRDLVRRLLVLSADHELDPTTYAVRAVANTGLNPYRLVVAGFIAGTGRRLAFGRVDSISRLLEQIVAATDPKEVIVARLREGEALPGFGSRIYAGGDPRAASLLAAMDRNLHGDQDLRRFTSAVSVMREATGLEPDFALVNAFLSRKLPNRQEGAALWLGRMAGWMAHAMEQYHGRDLVRPHATYVGPLPDRGEIVPPERS